MGATTTISAESPQPVGSTYYGFGSWSDGKAQSHEITAPATDTTYTATLRPAHEADALPGRGRPRRGGEPDHGLRDAEQAARRRRGGPRHRELPALQRRRSRRRHGRERKLRLSSLTDTIDGPTLRSAGNSWTESTVNWSTRPTAALDRDRRPRRRSRRTRPVEYNVKPLVGGDGTVTFALLPASSDGIDFASREYADATKRPVLELLVSNADHTGADGADRPRRAGDRRPPRGPVVDARDGQPRRHELRDLPRRRAAGDDGQRDELLGHDRQPADDLPVHGEGARRRRQPLAREQRRQRDDARGAAHDADVHAGRGRPRRGRHAERRTSAPPPSCRPEAAFPSGRATCASSSPASPGPVVEREAAA